LGWLSLVYKNNWNIVESGVKTQTASMMLHSVSDIQCQRFFSEDSCYSVCVSETYLHNKYTILWNARSEFIEYSALGTWNKKFSLKTISFWNEQINELIDYWCLTHFTKLYIYYGDKFHWRILNNKNLVLYWFWILIVLLCEPLPIERSATILFLKIKAMSINPLIGLVVFGL
jgi:hypothetical protein